MALLIEIEPGYTIERACRHAVATASLENKTVKFLFRDTWMYATRNSNPDDLVAEYKQASLSRLRQWIGD